MMHRLATTLLVAAVGCTKPDPRGPMHALARQTQESVAVHTDGSVLIAIDSFVFSDEVGEVLLYEFAVQRTGAVDTIPGVMALDWPVLMGDSVVTGIAIDTVGTRSAGFKYDLLRHRLDTIPLPDDLLIWLTRVAFSSDGQHIAYVGLVGDGTGHGVVRRWPDLQLRIETPPVPVPATDAFVGAAVWWAANGFQIGVTCEDGGSAWFRGTLREGISTWEECPRWAHVWIAERSTGGRLVFRIGKARGRPGGIGISLLRVDRCQLDSTALWTIVNPTDNVDLGEVVYGQPPSGWEQLVPPSRLEPGCYVASVGPGPHRVEFTIAPDNSVRETRLVP